MAEFMIVYHFLSTFPDIYSNLIKVFQKEYLFRPEALVFRLCFNRQKSSAESEI